MKLQHLRFFAAVVDCGGVVKAAERLNVSQPAVSTGIKSLERVLGQPLFERSGAGRHVRPTAKGLEFHKNAVEILRKCETARAQFLRRDAQPAKLRIGLLKTIASHQVASVARGFQSSRPDLQLRFREGGAIQLREWLRRGHIDVAWTVLDKSGDNARQLWREPFVVLAGAGHRLARNARARLSWSDLDGEDLILRACCEMPRGRLWPESVQMRVVARAERDELALKLVEEGLGIAIAPRSLANESVVVRLLQDSEVNRSIGLRWRKDLAEGTLTTVLDAFSRPG